MAQGKYHEYEPDGEALSFIDFEDSPEDGGMPLDDPDGREQWNIEAMTAVNHECNLGPSAALGFVGILRTQGEAAAWRYLGELVTAAGYDVYDSDSRFEVFEGGTAESYPAEKTDDLRAAAAAVVENSAAVSTPTLRDAIDALADALRKDGDA